MGRSFREIFRKKKSIMGMIHLAGDSPTEKIERALQEIEIYQQEGVDAAIVENYHGPIEALRAVLERSRNAGIIRGVNVLGKTTLNFNYATTYGSPFVQLDNIQSPTLDADLYNSHRAAHPNIAVFGGVRFKYTPLTGKPLDQDIREAMSRCEAIVTTGAGTGIETPIDKLEQFRVYMCDFPLIVGAGVTAENVVQQLSIADGAIIGSYFKPQADTQQPVDRSRVRKLMDIVRGL